MGAGLELGSLRATFCRPSPRFLLASPAMATPATLSEALEQFEPVIGLEVHAQLQTESKLFSGAPNRYDPDQPNGAISPYCIGLPGQLPVLNARAVELAITAGLALGCEIRERSVWARKQYFYPDLPKGYQISQYDEPICEHGELEVELEDDDPIVVRIMRIHMEEDAGKSIHVRGAPYSLVDCSRAGVPLVEIVTEPDLRSARQASSYLRQLRAILRTLGVCDGNLEKGNFRCDANVSIRPKGETKLGQRVELKNINSFRFVEQAIELEILRHAKLLSEGGRVVQETRLFDPDKNETRSMRSKEEAADYRYFPDPDLPPLVVPAEQIASLKASLPELPAARRARWMNDWKVPEESARTFAEEVALADYFDAAVGDQAQLAPAISNLIKVEVMRELKDDPEVIQNAKLRPEDLRTLVERKESGKLSSSQVKKLLAKLWKDGGDLEKLLAAEGDKVDDPAVLGPMVDELLAANPKEADKLREGQAKVASFFVGQIMKKTRGKADPAAVQRILAERAKA